VMILGIDLERNRGFFPWAIIPRGFHSRGIHPRSIPPGMNRSRMKPHRDQCPVRSMPRVINAQNENVKIIKFCTTILPLC